MSLRRPHVRDQSDSKPTGETCLKKNLNASIDLLSYYRSVVLWIVIIGCRKRLRRDSHLG